MISLKEHIDAWDQDVSERPAGAYRSLLVAIAASSARAVPELGKDLENRLSALDLDLPQPVTIDQLDKAARQVENAISAWAEKANNRHQQNGREIREIVTGIATIADSFRHRDQSTDKELGDLTKRLRAAADLTDPAAMRKSIIESTTALTACSQRITNEGSAVLTRLAADIEGYRSRLKDTEQLSLLDPLTGLANRRGFDFQLNEKVGASRPFSLIMIDLNNFKQINDQFGHLPGDDVLKQFADELRKHFQQAETVARWGGDEFAVIICSNGNDVQARIARFRRCALREYSVKTPVGNVNIPLYAAIGVVSWDGRENRSDLLARADRQMYNSKKLPRSQASGSS